VNGSPTALPGARPRAVLAAALAATAEAGIVYLPVAMIAREAGDTGGPLVHYPLFLILFVAATTLATRFRASPRLAGAAGAIAVALGLVQAVVWWTPRPVDLAGSVLLVLVVALRIVTLGLRDWRSPVNGSFALGAVILLAEIATASPATGWAPLLPAVVPVFFLASLASRAASVRLVGTPADGGPAVPRRVGAPLLVGGLALTMGVAGVLGGPRGALAGLGRAAFPILSQLLSILLRVVGVLSWPFIWLLQRLGLDASVLQHRLRDASEEVVRGARSGEPPSPLLGRIVGVLVLVGLIALLLVTIRAIGRSRARVRRVLDEFGPPPGALPGTRGPGRHRRPRLRRELPVETVRRLYAEVLLLLERHGMVRGSSVTPQEHLAAGGAAFPDLARDLAVLTRAYEDVRYGYVAIPEAVVQDLRRRHARITEVLRARRAPEPAAPAGAP